MTFGTMSVNGTSPADTLVSAGDGPTLIGNSDTTNTLWLGQNNAITPGRLIDTIPLTPQGWVVVDGKEDIYGITLGPAVNVFLIPGGLAFFQEFVSSGATIFVQGTPPTANAIGDIWYDSSNGMVLHQWNGVAWVPYSIGTAAIAPGSITAPLIAANTITAAQIAAHTITTTELITGMIYAGIVDATTVTAATFVGSTFRGTNFIINNAGTFFYSGTPAAGNLIMSIAPANGTDAFGNTFQQGFTCADPALLLFPSRQAFEGTPAFIQSNFSAPAVNQYLQMLLQGPSTNVVGARDSVQFQMNSAAKDNSSNANCSCNYTGSNGVLHEFAYFDATGFNILAGSIIAAQPGATPAVPASWTTIPLTNSYSNGTNNGFIDVPQVRMLADNKTLQFKGTLACPATGSAINWGTMPASFPNANLGGIYGVLLVANYSGGTVDHIELHNNGVLSIHNAHNSVNFDISGVMCTQ